VRKFSAEEREVYKGTPSDKKKIGKQKTKKKENPPPVGGFSTLI
jgi:hypothetical protein